MSSADPPDQPPKYPKPKIMLIDLPAAATERLRAAGFNAQSGTFGLPYLVPRGKGYLPLVKDFRLPNYPEQEIVFADLEGADPKGEEDAKRPTPSNEDWFAHTGSGEVDPRPLTMLWGQDFSDRILESGGVFVIFAAPRVTPDIVLGELEPYSKSLKIRTELSADTWSLLSTLSAEHLAVESDPGTEMTVLDDLGTLSSFLRRHSSEVRLPVVLRPQYPLSGEKNTKAVFLPLAVNKFGKNVAGVICVTHEKGGAVLILPQIENKVAAVIDLVQNVLPEVFPRLFPDHEGGRWVHREEYEHPSILERKAQQLEVQRKATEEVTRLDREIDAERSRWGFLHGLITKSGRELVADVKAALEFVGFTSVVDVDVADKPEANKQEDLQVHDRTPLLLVEVKGLGGMPTESDTLQVTKYVLRRVRQLNRSDVTGLSLVNHQRNLPGLERDHPNAFTTPQVQDATQNGTGLMTTWDMYCLIRGMIRWNWPADSVKGVFYGKGRLNPLPCHYQLVGEVVHYFTERSVVSISLTTSALRSGERIGYRLKDQYFEEKVESLQVNGKAVSEATQGQKAGIKTSLKRNEIPVGTQVFRIGL